MPATVWRVFADGVSPKLTPQREPRRVALARSARLILIVVLAAGIAACGSHPTPPPQVAPSPSATAPQTGGGIALAGWKLSIPEENDDGDATSIQPATTKAPWLTTAPDGGLEFWAPTTGATTANSEHPRTELQSLTYFQAGTAVHTLTASVTLTQLPQDGRGVILGQRVPR